MVFRGETFVFSCAALFCSGRLLALDVSLEGVEVYSLGLRGHCSYD